MVEFFSSAWFPSAGLWMEWLQLLLRSLHVIVGIAWIGASFYFVWLDNHLEKPLDPELLRKGVDGELWAVHGGGFYNPQKYMLAPAGLPQRLHWFYWESYSTWLSGFALFVALYLFQANTYDRPKGSSLESCCCRPCLILLCRWLARLRFVMPIGGDGQ